MDENIKQLGTNLVGVIKAVVRDVAHEREKATSEFDIGGRSGTIWSTDEENQLWKEFTLATELIAFCHRRTAGAIRSRLYQMERDGKQEF